MNHSAQLRIAGLLVILGFLVFPLHADQARMMTDMQSKLTDPGERLRMSTAPHPDGSPSSVEITMDPETGEERQQARGLITLRIYPSADAEEPRLTLVCYELDFVPADGLLEAVGNVSFRQEGIDATAQEMTYNVDEGFIEMRGDPIVNQRTGERNARFEGMDLFIVKTLEDGSRDVQMRGPNEIHILMSSIGPEDPEFVVPASTEGITLAEEEPAPRIGLGEEIDILVSPRGQIHPIVDAEIDSEGELALFRGEGSVRLRTEEIDLRSDELIYNARGQRLEATTNVFFRKDTLEADAGRLDYDLEAGRIVLTVDPDVRQFDAEKVIRIWNNDWFIINLREGGGYDISYGATTRTGQTEIMDRSDYEGTTPGNEVLTLPVMPKPVNVVELDPQRPIIRETVRTRPQAP